MWEQLALNEFMFYKHLDNTIQDINNQIHSLDDKYYIFSSGYLEEQTGLYRRTGQSIDNQVANKVDSERGLMKGRERVLKRCHRHEQAFARLHPVDQYRLLDIYINGFESIMSKSDRCSMLKLYRSVRNIKLNEQRIQDAAIKAAQVEDMKRMLTK